MEDKIFVQALVLFRFGQEYDCYLSLRNRDGLSSCCTLVMLSRMRILLCPSLNGFGHIRRLIALRRGLVLLGHKVNFLVTSDLTFSQYELIQNEGDIPFVLDKSSYPDDLFIEGPYVKKPQNGYSPNLRSLEDLNFDYVVADTVTWPTLIKSPALFIGQFTWSMYHGSLRRDEILSTFVSALGIELFSWPMLKSHPGYRPLPLIDYWNIRSRRINLLNQIGFARNGLGREALRNSQANKTVPISGIPEFLDSNGWLPKYIVMRAGIGNVMEAISAGAVPILTLDEDLDVQYNKQLLVKGGYAIDIDDLNSSILEESKSYRAFDGPVISQIEFAKAVLSEMG